MSLIDLMSINDSDSVQAVLPSFNPNPKRLWHGHFIMATCQLYEEEELEEMPGILKSLNSGTKSVVHGDFYMRYSSIESWFLRCASTEKLSFLRALFEQVKDRKLMPMWCRLIRQNGFDKIAAYSQQVDPVHYDKILFDNNRTCEPKTLKETIEDTLDWFKQYDGDIQEAMYLALLKMGGGGIIRLMSGHANRYYRANPRKLSSSLTVHNKKPKEPLETGEIMEMDLNDPLDAELYARNKEWSQMMGRYRTQLFGAAHKSAKEGKGKSKASKKSNKSDSTKKSKKGKKTAKASAGIDYLQMMPITIVKKIFSYLDKKTLKKIKVVNEYWSYAVESFEKDVKGRKMLDKAFTKLMVGVRVPPVQDRCIDRAPLCKPINRNRCLNARGTVSQKVSRRINVPNVKYDGSVFVTACAEMETEYLLPVNESMKQFPRKTPDTNQRHTAHRTPPCVKYNGKTVDKKSLSTDEPIGNISLIRRNEVPVMNPEDIDNSSRGSG